MIIQNFILGAYQTNSYCLKADKNSDDCVIIDTGLENGQLIDYLKDNNLNPVALILTHGHADHIMGVSDLRENWPNIKVAIHKNDASMLNDPVENLSAMSGFGVTFGSAEVIIEEDGLIEYAGIQLQVLCTPGHTRGGICLYSESDSVVFVGDTLFAESIGRTDLPGGSGDKLIAGIKAKLLTLPGDTKAYPGHGPATSIGHEKTYNLYLR